MVSDILLPPSEEIIDNGDAIASSDQSIHQMGPDESSPTGDNDPESLPFEFEDFAVKQNYDMMLQFEDFANHNAFKLLENYCKSHLIFNDDVQAGTGIAELIALEISRQTNAPMEETQKKLWLVDSKGLIVSSRKNFLQDFKKIWAHEHEPIYDLLGAVKITLHHALRANINSGGNVDTETSFTFDERLKSAATGRMNLNGTPQDEDFDASIQLVGFLESSPTPKLNHLSVLRFSSISMVDGCTQESFKTEKT